MKGKWIKKSKDGIAVVFVHGILSSGDRAWQHDNGNYWPSLLADEESLDPLSVFIYTYKTAISSGNYDLNDVVDDLKESMTKYEIFGYKRIVFVCHSMGGIVVRKLLVERLLDFIDRDIEVGLFLVASPSLGSKYANYFETLGKLLGQEQALALVYKNSNTWLNDLDKAFLNMKDEGRLKIKGKELLEDNSIVFKKLIRKQIVEPFSGRKYFGGSIKIADSDHFTIAKPENSGADQHELLCNFIIEFTYTRLESDGTQISCVPMLAIKYLEDARDSVETMGQERQRILTEARACNFNSREQVISLYGRIDRYLHEDNIRPKFQRSIKGLQECLSEIPQEGPKKKDAFIAYSSTLTELMGVLDGLNSNFYPWGSGMGVVTLIPIYDEIKIVHDALNNPQSQEFDLGEIREKMDELILHAIQDDSHEEWVRVGGKVEALSAKLKLAFSIK